VDTDGSPGSTRPAPVATWASSGRIVATVVSAVAVAVLAFIVATSSGGAAEVVVDGTGGLPGSGSDATSTLGDPVTGAVADPAAGGGATDQVIVVEIVGAVPHPGVYRLPAGARVGDLVAVAGGYGGRVDTARAERELNQAARLQDGDQIRVPARGEPEQSQATGGGPAAAAPDQGLIDLNSATDAELDALPGIGPVTVAKIVAAREEAPFTTIEDLRTRGLVGQKTFDNIRGSLVVR
jgi:competence protein ComEA